MCGIVGFINKDNQDKKARELKNMMDKIIHRGPDSEGSYISENAAIGFRRLSIIDLAGGSQPIYNEDNTLLVFFNGEIYNFSELRKDLEQKGHIFKTNTDTEVIIHGYEEYKENIAGMLRGMFTFVIWDEVQGKMYGARDPFGIKPFYYAKMNDTLFFASEIKSFLEHPNFNLELNKEALRPYLTFQFSSMAETFFKGVKKIPQGHYFTYQNGEIGLVEYYDINFEEEKKPMEYYIDEIGKEVKSSVDYHKISDVPLASFLSGGVDSSYITALLMPHKTFSVGFTREKFDETGMAKELSKELNIENVSKIISADEFFSSLENVMYYSDEPHANLSAVPLYFLAELARKDVTVVLSGEGADEAFGGYETYMLSSTDKKYRKIPKPFRYLAGKIAFNLPWFHGRKFLIKNGLPVEDYYVGSAFIFPENEKKKVLKKEYLNGKTFKEITAPIFARVKDKDELAKMKYLDFHLWLTEDILLKADKMTMAHSLELRVPFLDKEVMEIARKIPSEYQANDNTTKYVFRKSAEKELPDEWSKRPKWGFPVPFHFWIREEKYFNKVMDLFKQDFVKEFFNLDYLFKLMNDHFYKGKENGRKIYTVYIFLIWYKVYFIDKRYAK